MFNCSTLGKNWQKGLIGEFSIKIIHLRPMPTAVTRAGLSFGLFETVCQESIVLGIWPFFGIVWKLKKIVPSCYGKIWEKITKFYKILKIVVLLKFHQKFGLFSFLRIWPFLKLLMANFGLFSFFGPGNPGREELLVPKDIKRMLKWPFWMRSDEWTYFTQKLGLSQSTQLWREDKISSN